VQDREEKKVFKDYNPFSVDWIDTAFQIKTGKGELEEAGTVLNICNQIIFLKPLSKSQLLELSKIVTEAVDHELSKR
jgi:hypothetical protein